MSENRTAPSIDELMKFYNEIAELERLKSGRPCKRRVDNVLSYVRSVCREARIATDAPFSSLNRQALDKYFLATIQRGLSQLTAINGIESIRALTARWCRNYYEDKGWQVLPVPLPFVRRNVKRYSRPAPELLARVRDWYSSLDSRSDKMPWLAATLMLEFAMRNGDARRLTWDNFVRRGEQVYLCYTPSKTALSSGRIVKWPVHPSIWTRLSAIRKDKGAAAEVLHHGDAVFRKLNSELRGLGFSGSKACYELRKICIDHVYQRFGAEMAVAISGDDIRTITKYYADPSEVARNSICVFDMLSEDCANMPEHMDRV